MSQPILSTGLTVPAVGCLATTERNDAVSGSAFRNRYTLVSAAGVIAAFTSGDWRAALVIFMLTCCLLAYMISRAIARA